MSRSARAGQVTLTLIGILATVIALSVYAPSDDPFEPSAQVLIATFGAGFGLFVVALAVAGLNSGLTWPWLALWVLPAFLISHVALLGTVVPDAILAAIAMAALAASRPTRDVRGTSRGPLNHEAA